MRGSSVTSKTRHQAGGNDQVQRGAMLNGGSRSDHAAVARSDVLTVAYVATTQVLPQDNIQWDYQAQVEASENDETRDPGADSASKTSKRSWRSKQ